MFWYAALRYYANGLCFLTQRNIKSLVRKKRPFLNADHIDLKHRIVALLGSCDLPVFRTTCTCKLVCTCTFLVLWVNRFAHDVAVGTTLVTSSVNTGRWLSISRIFFHRESFFVKEEEGSKTKKKTKGATVAGSNLAVRLFLSKIIVRVDKINTLNYKTRLGN